MNQIKKIENLVRLSYFDKNTLSQFIDLSPNSFYSNVNRWLKLAKLIQLKKGLYVTSDFINSLQNKTSYLEFIAGKLREPSYLTAEYVLQKYNIISESVYGFTSVTLKSKRIYRNKLGVFIYRGIKKELFCGYDIVESDGFNIKVATRAKALFDYFYYKLFKIKEVDQKLIESFRLNYDEVSRKDWQEFSKYCEMTGTQKMVVLAKIARKIK